MTDTIEFLHQVEVSKNNAAQISALDMLQNCFELHNKINDLCENAHMQPFLLFGILESVKFHILSNAQKALPREEQI